ncbi:MAG TPA: ATP-binding protein [Streptosporangiaceae bacterium]|nr:ATP-binding protein [Streptosporangiaceae bacterium]
MATVEMSFTALPAHVRTARLVATAVARRSGVDESLLDEVRLAVGEACSRAVEAHQAHCPGKPVRVALTGAQGRFEVVVADSAAAADEEAAGDGEAVPAGAAAAARDGAARDGAAGERTPRRPGPPRSALPAELGLAVIAGLADDVEIDRTPDGLSIRMSWPASNGQDRRDTH